MHRKAQCHSQISIRSTLKCRAGTRAAAFPAHRRKTAQLRSLSVESFFYARLECLQGIDIHTSIEGCRLTFTPSRLKPNDLAFPFAESPPKNLAQLLRPIASH